MEAPTSTPQQGQEAPDSKPRNPGADSTAAAAAAASVASADQDRKKRKLDHEGFLRSNYSKICSVVKELRPYFVEVSRTTNFRDSKSANEIQIRMKSLVELTKQLRTELSSTTKCHETPVKEPLSAVVKEEIIEEQQEGHMQPQPGEVPASSVNAMENGIRGSLEESLLNSAQSISEK